MHIENGNISLYDCHFAGRNDGKDAVAVYRCKTDSSTLTLSSCSFDSISGWQAILYAKNPQLLLTSSNFTCCTNNDDENGLGMISVSHNESATATNQTMTIEHCISEDNARRYGAFHMLGWSFPVNPQTPMQILNVSNSTFERNVGLGGGAIAAWAVPRVYIQGCNFTGNMAQWGLGAALYVYGYARENTFLTMLDSRFTENNATALALSDLTIKSAYELGKITDHGECAVYLSACQCIGIARSVFSNIVGTGLCIHGHGASLGYCYKHSDGQFFSLNDALGSSSCNCSDLIKSFLGADQSVEMGLNIIDSDLSGYIAASLVRSGPEVFQPVDPLSGGAGLDIRSVQYSVLRNLTLNNNKGRQGSGLYLDDCFALVVWNSTLDNNNATNEGGAIASVSSHDHVSYHIVDLLLAGH